MIQTSWTIARVFGIPIRAHLSVGLLALYLLLEFGQNIGLGLFVAGVLLLSILLHELAHSGVAIAFGGAVREIVLQLLGGCALISRMPHKAWQETLMALAGPLLSLALAALCLILAFLFPTKMPDPRLPIIWVEPNLYLLLAGSLNLGLGCFNLIPAFPMDGGRVLRSALESFGWSKYQATRLAVTVSKGIAVLWGGLWVANLLFGFEVPCPLGSFVAQYLWSIVFGAKSLLLPLIAYMIWVMGERELATVRAMTYYGDWR